MAAPGRPPLLAPLGASQVMMGAAGRVLLPWVGQSVLPAPAPPAPGPSYEPSFTLDSFLPGLPAVITEVARDSLGPDPAYGLSEQVDEQRVSLWLVATVSFLILLAVCAASLMDVGGFLRDYLYRRLEQQ